MTGESAQPSQTTTISCNRDSQTCSEATAALGSRNLILDVDIYEIERWNSQEVVTKPRESLLGCVRIVRRINRVQQSVTGIRSTISTENICEGVEPAELFLVLRDGTEIWRELSQEYDRRRDELLLISPELRERLKD